MDSALQIALSQAKEQGATRIHRLGMRVGALSGVVPDALEFAFTVLKRDTIAESASLEVEYVPLRLRCAACNVEFEPEAVRYDCPTCGTQETEIRGGQELDVVLIELSVEEDNEEPKTNDGQDMQQTRNKEKGP